MNLEKKRKELMRRAGQVLSSLPSKKQVRKVKRQLQHSRRTMREQINSQEELIQEEIEQDRLMREYLASDDGSS